MFPVVKSPELKTNSADSSSVGDRLKHSFKFLDSTDDFAVETTQKAITDTYLKHLNLGGNIAET